MNEIQTNNFDYSALDVSTAKALRKYDNQLDRLYSSYSAEVGEVLYSAQQEFANPKDGVFISWVEYKGFKPRSAYNYINIYKTLQNLQSIEDKSAFLEQPKSIQNEMSKPSADPEINQMVFDGEIKTHKEYKAMEREKREAELKAKEYEAQLKQREQENDILQKQLEQAENKPPEVIEKYSVPDDYEEMKEKLSELHIERADLRSRLHNLHMTEKEREEKSRKYDELNEAINAMDMKLSDDQLRFKNRKFVNDLLMQSRILMRDVTPLIYTIDSLHEDDLNQMNDSLENLAKELYKISSDIKKQLNRGVVINE